MWNKGEDKEEEDIFTELLIYIYVYMYLVKLVEYLECVFLIVNWVFFLITIFLNGYKLKFDDF